MSRAILEKERGHAVSEIELRSLISADYVVKAQFLIAVEQPGDFHIDMHMMLLPNGHAAVNDSLQALALTTQWATEDMVNSKPKPLGPNATKNDQQQYKSDLEIWAITSQSLASDLKSLASGAASRTRFETKMAQDLIAAGIKVERIAGVFPATRNLAPMNFLNGEHATNAKGERFSVMLGGDKRAEQHFVAALAQMPGAPQRVHFLDRSLTPTSLAASGGISCRAKIESMPLRGAQLFDNWRNRRHASAEPGFTTVFEFDRSAGIWIERHKFSGAACADIWHIDKAVHFAFPKR